MARGRPRAPAAAFCRGDILSLDSGQHSPECPSFTHRPLNHSLLPGNPTWEMSCPSIRMQPELMS